jgi:2-polyprenyl-3-methyl-5-hydroxy-6-metoxy-1,4-benzoquinol methylase
VQLIQACPICKSGSVRFFSKAFDRLSEEPQDEYSVMRCSNCSFAWTVPQPPEEELGTYYPPNYFGDISNLIRELKSDRLRKSSPWRMELEKVRLVEKLSSGGRILDVGCGAGQFLFALDRRRWRTEGIEQDEVACRAMKALLPEISVWNDTIKAFRGTPGSYDVITFWHSLEHVTRPREVLQKAYGLLHDEGRVVVSLPNVDSLQALVFRHHWYAFGDVPRHLWHFSPRSLEMLLTETGFFVDRHLFFSKAVNFHCWKHSLRSLSMAAVHNLMPYYFLKPVLHLLPLLERMSRKWGVMTMIAQKSPRLGTDSHELTDVKK